MSSTSGPSLLRLRRAPNLRSRNMSGDAAFSELYRRHHQALYRYSLSILRHEQDAQDALQNTMVKAHQALTGEERDFELRPWLFRVAHNECISLIRRRRETTELAEELPAAATTEERHATRAELRQLEEDLSDLPERQRSALVLRELSGLSHDEIAEVLGVSPAIVKSTIFEARSALLQYREGRNMSCSTLRAALSDGDKRVLRGRRQRAHLRDCAGCRAFQAGLVARPGQLAALAPPLPAAAALLHHLLPGAAGAASSAGATGSAGVAGLTATSAGSSVLGGLTAKLAAGAAVAALAAGGTAAVHSGLRPDRARPISPQRDARPATPRPARIPDALPATAPARTPQLGGTASAATVPDLARRPSSIGPAVRGGFPTPGATAADPSPRIDPRGNGSGGASSLHREDTSARAPARRPSTAPARSGRGAGSQTPPAGTSRPSNSSQGRAPAAASAGRKAPATSGQTGATQQTPTTSRPAGGPQGQPNTQTPGQEATAGGSRGSVDAAGSLTP